MNAVCSSSGRRYRANRSMLGSHTSPTSTRGRRRRRRSAPAPVDLVHLVAVQPDARRCCRGRGSRVAGVGQRRVLDQRRRESMRTPSTPRSNQNRRTSSNSARTSGCSQLRSGCSGANRCRYHCPGGRRRRPRPGRAAEALTASRSAAARRPRRGRAGTRTASRSGARLGAPAPPGTTGARSEMWLGTTSTMVRMPARAPRRSAARPRPACRTPGRWRGSRRRRSRRRPSARGTRG